MEVPHDVAPDIHAFFEVSNMRLKVDSRWSNSLEDSQFIFNVLTYHSFEIVYAGLFTGIYLGGVSCLAICQYLPIYFW